MCTSCNQFYHISDGQFLSMNFTLSKVSVTLQLVMLGKSVALFTHFCYIKNQITVTVTLESVVALHVGLTASSDANTKV